MKGGEFVKDVYIKIEKINDKIDYLTKPNVLYPTVKDTTNVENYLFRFNQSLVESSSNNYTIGLEKNEKFNTSLLNLEDFQENEIFYKLLEIYIDLKEGENIELPESEEFLKNNKSNNIKKFYICLHCSINSIQFNDINAFEEFIKPENFFRFKKNTIYNGE